MIEKEVKAEMIRKILSHFDAFDGSRSQYVLFKDWCKMMALSISNQVWHSNKREEEYMATANQYKPEELKRFTEMFRMLTIAFDNELDDYLGKIYMQGGMGSKQTGQFFTPFHLAELTAKLGTKKGEKIVMNEPSSGGGGMVLATAKAIQKNGDNYQELLQATAQDLDWNGVYMTYVQLSIAGIQAKVIQGDTLAGEKRTKSQILYTPMYMLKGGTW